MEDHWRLRDLSATILSDVNRKCVSGGMVTRRHGNQYPKMQRQIFVTLNKVLHNPKTTLPSVYGAVCCEVGVRALGETAVDALLLPVFCEMSENLSRLLATQKSALAHVQIQRCLHALTVRMEEGGER